MKRSLALSSSSQEEAKNSVVQSSMDALESTVTVPPVNTGNQPATQMIITTDQVNPPANTDNQPAMQIFSNSNIDGGRSQVTPRFQVGGDTATTSMQRYYGRPRSSSNPQVNSRLKNDYAAVEPKLPSQGLSTTPSQFQDKLDYANVGDFPHVNSLYRKVDYEHSPSLSIQQLQVTVNSPQRDARQRDALVSDHRPNSPLDSLAPATNQSPITSSLANHPNGDLVS